MHDHDQTKPQSATPETSPDPGTVAQSGTPTVLSAPAGELRIPGYEVRGELARGGMGVVYAARDLILDREVAIKTLLPGAPVGPDDIRRFGREARVTARLTHPGVPAVHQLSTLADGRPFLAMKLVRGNTLAAALQGKRAAASALPRFVQVFEQIAQAVGFAHSQCLIHRDLKPSNVMVGAFGEVQVMDWGIARAVVGGQWTVVREEGEPRVAATRSGARETDTDADLTTAGSVMGTPAYMAPEQARGEPLDARADVFALGGVLCDVLTGRPPHAGKTSQEAMANAAAGDLSDALARLDACGADAELVAVCRRCLAPDKADRPADGQAVAELVAAYWLGTEERLRAAEAERVAAEATAREQAKRRRVAVRLGSLVVLAVVVGGAVSAWLAVEARSERDNARSAEGKEREAADLARKREAEAKESAVAEGKAREAEKQAADLARRKEAEAVERERKEKAAKEKEQKARQTAEEVAGFMRVIFAGEGTDGEAGRSRDFARRRTVLEAMDDAANKIEGKFGDRPEVEAEVRTIIGKTYSELGAYPEAEAQHRRALEIREGILGPDHPDTLQSVNNLGILLQTRGDLAGAEPLYRRALAGYEKVLGPDHPDTLRQVNNLGFLLQTKGDLAGAEPLMRRALAGYEKVLGPDHPATLVSVGNLGHLLKLKGDLGGAEPLIRRALAGYEKVVGPDHPDTLRQVNNLGSLLQDRGDLAGAEPLWRRALAGREKALGPDHPDTLAGANNLGMLLRARGDQAGAEPLLRRALAGWEKVLGPDHPHTLAGANNLALLLFDARRYDEAAVLFERAYRGFAKRPEAALVAVLSRGYLGLALLGAGKPAEAEPHLLAGYEGLARQKVLNDTNRNRLRWAAAGLVEVYEKTNQPGKAAEWREMLAALPPEVAPMPHAVRFPAPMPREVAR